MYRKKRIITFKTDYDKKLEEKILLELLTTDFDNFTLLNLSRHLGNKYKEGSKGWDKLRLHLIDMAKRGLIEERHFGEDAGDWNGIVDYAIEKKGLEIVKKLSKQTTH